ncbi:MAG: penicillin-binding protein 2 [Oscillospiraceae bacterium]|nr:penicillin-binding protein 2 [Oscillospiraceae bacterium]
MKFKFDKFQSRSAMTLFVVICLFFVCIIRLMAFASSETLKASAESQSTATIKLYNVRGDIYDTNYIKLTGSESKTVSIILPTPKGVISLSSLLSGEGLKTALQRLNSNKPILVEVDSKNMNGTITYEVPIRYSDNQLAAHVVGYLNSEGKGTSGIESGLNDVLDSGVSASLKYSADAQGNMLPGLEATINNINSLTNNVVLTLDSRIQKFVEEALSNTVAGAAVVTEAGTGKIRAMASVPTFNQNNLADSINAPNSPFINRALSAYSVGSSFKPCVAASALENGITADFSYECTGSLNVSNQRFRCHKLSGHGLMDMKSAIAYSCNTYFYNLALTVGADNIYNMEKLCGFGNSLSIGGGLVSDAGGLTDIATLRRLDTALANLAIGQGDLMISPLGITTLYDAICSGGKYTIPSIVEGYLTAGKFTAFDNSAEKTQVMRKSTADTIKSFLISALDEGTGTTAKPSVGIAGAKTSTAQTGWIIGEKDVLNGWICGFYEISGKEYVISIMVENITSSSTDCTPVFKNICEKIATLYN